MITLKLSESGQELAKLAIILYGDREYGNAHGILAQQLLNTSVEAGRLAAEAAAAPRDSAYKIAARAVEAVDKLLMLIKLLKSEGVYSARETKYITELAEAILAALKPMAVKPVKKPVKKPAETPVVQPQVQPQPQAQVQPQPAPQAPAAPVSQPAKKQRPADDDDGFNDIYEAI